jgi:phage gpG-like protein
MNVSVDIKPSAALANQLRNARVLPLRFLQGMGKALNKSGPMIVGNAVKYRFTSERGPFPVSQNKLGRVTGRLRQSITSTKPQINTASNEIVMGFGSNVKYFGVHEFGFSGSVAVKAHARKNGQQVRSHSRFIKIAARRPMFTELDHDRTLGIVFENARREIIKAIDETEGGPA